MRLYIIIIIIIIIIIYNNDNNKYEVELVFRWWSKCISSVISRTASRNILFSSARISKTLNVDRVCPPNDDYQDVTQVDDLHAFIGYLISYK